MGTEGLVDGKKLRVDGKKVYFWESSAVELARVIAPLERQMVFDAWDIELLLAVKGLPWDRRRADPAARIRLPAPEVPPEHVLPPPVGEPAGPRSRRVYIRRDVEIRKYGVTIGVPGVHGHHSGNDRSGAFRRVPGQDRAENA